MPRKNRGKVYSVGEISAIVSPIADRRGAGRMYLFGSYARGTADGGSDVDILAEPGAIKGYLAFTDFAEELEEALGKRVDLVSARCVPEFLARIQGDLVCIRGRSFAFPLRTRAPSPCRRVRGPALSVGEHVPPGPAVSLMVPYLTRRPVAFRLKTSRP